MEILLLRTCILPPAVKHWRRDEGKARWERTNTRGNYENEFPQANKLGGLADDKWNLRTFGSDSLESPVVSHVPPNSSIQCSIPEWAFFLCVAHERVQLRANGEREFPQFFSPLSSFTSIFVQKERAKGKFFFCWNHIVGMCREKHVTRYSFIVKQRRWRQPKKKATGREQTVWKSFPVVAFDAVLRCLMPDAWCLWCINRYSLCTLAFGNLVLSCRSWSKVYSNLTCWMIEPQWHNLCIKEIRIRWQSFISFIYSSP